MHNLRALGAKIAILASEKEIKLSEIAKKIDIEYLDMKAFVAGLLFLSWNQIEQIAKILDTTFDELYDCSFEDYNTAIFRGTIKNEVQMAQADAILDKVIHLMDIELARLEERMVEKIEK